MQQPQYRGQHKVHYRQHRFLLRLVAAEDFRLGGFDEPIAVIAPDKVVKALCDRAELIFAVSSFDCVHRFVQAGEQFQGVDRYRLVVDFWSDLAWSMHLPEASDVPKFRREVQPYFNLLFVESNILSSRGDAHQTEVQAMSAILVDSFEWIERVATVIRCLT